MNELVTLSLNAIAQAPLDLPMPKEFGADVNEIATCITNCYEEIVA